MSIIVSEDADSKFYKDAEKYWEKVTPTVDGMLGGFEKVSPVDITLSKRLILGLIKDGFLKLTVGRALDCGSGIGRVTKMLLLPVFDKVDMVEVTQQFLDESYKYIGDANNKEINRICLPLQKFSPLERGYDLIWCQWVTGHLTDSALVDFLKRSIGGLHSPSGGSLIVIKENVVSAEQPEFDSDDSSFTRPISVLKDIFSKAGLELVREEQQTHFPKELYPVWMFVLKPAVNNNNKPPSPS